MPVTRTDTNLSATITQTSLVDAIKTAFTNAGFSTPIDDYTSGSDRILVYSLVVDASKNYGTTFLRIRITSALVCNQQLFTGWNTSTKTGTNGGTEVSYTTLAAGLPITLVALNSGEVRLVLLLQSGVLVPLGMFVPTNRMSWYDLNSWSYGFIASTNTFSTWRSANLTPYNDTSFDILPLANSRMSSANSQTGRRDVLSGLIGLSQSNQGYAFKTSDDLACISANGSNRLDIAAISGSTEQYLILGTVAGSLGIRVQ